MLDCKQSLFLLLSSSSWGKTHQHADVRYVFSQLDELKRKNRDCLQSNICSQSRLKICCVFMIIPLGFDLLIYLVASLHKCGKKIVQISSAILNLVTWPVSV